MSSGGDESFKLPDPTSEDLMAKAAAESRRRREEAAAKQAEEEAARKRAEEDKKAQDMKDLMERAGQDSRGRRGY